MLQVKFLLVGLLLAAGFVAFQWLQSQPGIPPVRLPNSSVVTDAESADAASLAESARDRFVLPEDADIDGGSVTAPEDLLPALNDSDDWLRERLAESALPWIAETELVRTSATVLQNAAAGEVPRKFVEFLAPKGRFTVTSGTQQTVTAASFARYDSFVSTLTAFSPDQAAATFSAVEPLLAEALRELGGDESGKVATPRELAYGALGIALATPRGVEAANLVQPKVVYKYADEELEALLPLQKQLLRMGPANLEKLRRWLEDFGVALAPALTATPESAADELAP